MLSRRTQEAARANVTEMTSDMKISTDRQRELYATLKQLVEDRSLGESDIVRSHDQPMSEIATRFERDSDDLANELRQKRAGAEDAFLTKLSEARLTYEKDRTEHSNDQKNVDDDLHLRRTQSNDAAKKAWRMEREHVGTVHGKQRVKQQKAWTERQAIFEQHRAGLDHVEAKFHKVMENRGVEVPEAPEMPPPPPASSAAESLSTFMAKLEATRKSTQRLVSIPTARFLEDGWPVLSFLLIAVGIGLLLWLQLGFGPIVSFIVGAVASAVATWAICRLLKPWVRKSTTRAAQTVQEVLCEARQLFETAFQDAKSDAEDRIKKGDRQRDERLLDGDKAFRRKKDKISDEFDARQDHEAQRLEKTKADFEERWKTNIGSLSEQYRPTLDQLEQERVSRAGELKTQRDGNSQEAEASFNADWRQLVANWQNGLAGIADEIGQMNDYCRQRFPNWNEQDWSQWEAALEQDLAALRFGDYTIRLDDIPHGVPDHEDLTPPFIEYVAPALLAFPSRPSLMIRSHGAGRDEAVTLIQNIMLRMLTAFPPGKVRYTIIDPVGLGQNFSAFMHLADFDERFVTNRIWTESNHIQQRLADLTEHMENVIQKYLRNEFDSIQEYNRNAGEVAEPFHILVVANFPANFSDESARRLASIAASGARCGVYTLISVDDNASLPRDFDLDDLAMQANVLQWDDATQGFQWAEDELNETPLRIDSPPDDEKFSEIVKISGELAKTASRVEVPFSLVAPKPDLRWSRDSRSEIEVPLGRAGATKLQSMRLGKGTSQHVLISGKTGSGKSTLLHALITNAALYYSPKEIELYLIDFKKGVEFKPYATEALPHARVIAIESEREFGMSVLERLDEELKRRGDLFRNAGVQDVKGYRDAHEDAHIPRILLIIDEFQEFFVKDDKIAQDASLLLDRLVRQGRAFGIHVLLGSQTLAGAYTLARSTIGQMAVRVALQCSDGDAHLILSEENTAARLLNRPGEAIYNDANGRFEGNHPFQVVWLPDAERESYLRDVSDLGNGQLADLPKSIVFEGNVLAKLADNPRLRSALEQDAPTAVSPVPEAWLGAAVAIKDPTSVVFRRQSGANLLVVGQQDETALGVITAAIVGAAAHQPLNEDNSPRVHILDGTRPDAAEAGYWNSIAKKLPLDIQTLRPRDAAKTIGEIAEQLNERMENNDDTGSLVVLVVHNLSRFRDLKKSDDFNFSLSEESGEAVDKQLATILREGPNFGMHTIIWSDSYNNTIRFLDRASLRDLEMRVLFQMSGNDSANLMDSPAAAHLGARRAILYSDELGESEKFRPYGSPDDQWLDWVRQRFLERSEKQTADENQ